LAETLDAVATTAGYLASRSITTPDAKAARRDLQRSALRLKQMFETLVNGSTNQRREAEYIWPAIAATERLAYRTVAECWRLERVAQDPNADLTEGTAHYADVQSAARATADAVREGGPPPRITLEPGALTDELRGVRDALRHDPT
jgi:hypothetical protein